MATVYLGSLIRNNKPKFMLLFFIYIQILLSDLLNLNLLLILKVRLKISEILRVC